jgi:hypothetical protein
MIPYDIDPSLHAAEPQDTLDDGFSPPPHHHDEEPREERAPAESGPLEAALGAKSPF